MSSALKTHLAPLLVTGISVLLAAPAGAQCDLEELPQFFASDPDANEYFGSSVDLDGDVGVVGAPDDSRFTGAAYVYRFDGSQWVAEQKLIASDTAGLNERYGTRVALCGDVIAASAPSADGGHGAVYVSRFDGTQWNEVQKLTASDSTSSTFLGSHLDMNHERMVVGTAGALAPDGSKSGAAYVFRFDGTKWVEEQKLTPSTPHDFQRFQVVGLHEEVICVGAWRDSNSGKSQSGAAYVFRFDGAKWVEEQMLLGSILNANDWFGYSVTVTDSYLVVGAPFKHLGAGYVFRHDGDQWVEEQYLRSLNGERYLCWSVDAEGDQILLGVREDASHGVTAGGSAIVFQFDGTTWVRKHRLIASDVEAGDYLGYAVALFGDQALCGLPGRDKNDSEWNAGAACLFEISDLGLAAKQDVVFAGDTLELYTCGGLQSAPVLLGAVEVNGAPIFVPLAFNVFDAWGNYSFSSPVPGGLAGLEVCFLSMGHYQPGRVGKANLARVSFQ